MTYTQFQFMMLVVALFGLAVAILALCRLASEYSLVRAERVMRVSYEGRLLAIVMGSVAGSAIPIVFGQIPPSESVIAFMVAMFVLAVWTVIWVSTAMKLHADEREKRTEKLVRDTVTAVLERVTNGEV